MTYTLYRYQTMGTEVYNSETGPTIGHDNIETGFVVLPDDAELSDYFEPADYRSVEAIVSHMDDSQVRELHRAFGKVVLRLAA